jgi:UDP-2,3-diacylglucosamine pyrophosphatase LpxH
MATYDLISENLSEIYKKAPRLKLKKKSKYIIFSDLHLGNGTKRKDDFLRNSDMFLRVLEEYYYKQDYTLILNGDVEDLQKFHASGIKKAWVGFYRIAEKFLAENRLIKILGNHELGIGPLPESPINENILDAVVLGYKDEDIFIFHGHQAMEMFNKYSRAISVILRFLAGPLGIKNRSASHDSKRKYHVEQNSYRFSAENRIVSILGHTHRPLFESFSKYDTLRFQLERLLRDFPEKNKREKQKIRKQVTQLKKDLENLTKKEKDPQNSFYHEYLIYPCLFNSGCVIGRRGMTGIEINSEDIALVHWYDEDRRKKSWKKEDSVFILDKKYHKRIIKSDSFEYIFNRIHLLG